MRQSLTTRLAIPVLLLAASLGAAEPDAADGAGSLDLEGAVRVADLRLRVGPASLALEEGVVVPVVAPAGPVFEYVFVGRGRVELAADDPVERSQLLLFTGSSRLVEEFDGAALAIASDAAAAAIGSRPEATLTAAERQDAERRLHEWATSPERRLLEVESRAARDRVGDVLGEGFFCAVLEGQELGRFLVVVDPLAAEQVTVGQFVPVELDRKGRRKAKRELNRLQRRGMLLATELEDLGQWDTWVSTALVSGNGVPTPGTQGVEPTAYRLEAELDGRHLEMEAVARITLVALLDGLRAVTMSAADNLVIESVSSADGGELEFVRGRSEVTVLLPARTAAAEELVLEVRYRGSPFRRITSKAYAMVDSIGWYPRVGMIDRATYDVTLRWPKRLDVMGSGRVVDEGRDGPVRWQRRVLDRPAFGFGFEVGDFDLLREQVGDIEVVLGVDRLGRKISRDLAEEILATVRDVLELFEEAYGPYPLDRLEIATSPRDLSQGLLGFVTLSTAAIVDWDVLGALLGLEDRRTVIAHEIAHQWWGNVVGWQSYRDQWISEAMANYSALLYQRERLADSDKKVWWGPTTGWEGQLLATTDDGRPIESLGPVVLGARLDSSLASDAYDAIVYTKGAMVLDMLARGYGDERFLAVCRELVELAAFKIIRTEDFLKVLETLGGADLGWFADQYIFGTGIPEIVYDYEIVATEDGWAVEGEARQASTRHWRYAVVRRDDGRLDVRRTAVETLDVADSTLVAPFQIGLADEDADDDTMPMLVGRMLLQGEKSAFRFTTDRKPEVMWIDRDHDVLARFHCARRHPRAAAYTGGLELLAAGRTDEAAASFELALGEPVQDVPDAWRRHERDPEAEGRRLDALIHLTLARIALEEGDIDAAGRRLEAAEEVVDRSERWLFESLRVPLEGRLELLSGDVDRAYRTLKKGLLGRRAVDSAEGFAALAIAAAATGHDEIAERARSAATERGVDLGPLDGAGEAEDGGPATS